MTTQQPTHWPTWPFTRLTPEQMKELEAKIKQERRDSVGPTLF